MKKYYLQPIGGGFYLMDPAAKSFILARAEAEAAGIKIVVNSADRTRKEQEKLVEKYGLWDAVTNPTGAAAPGTSNHERGKAIDISVLSGDKKKFEQIMNRHGFRRTVPGEAWHWDYTYVPKGGVT
jgi:LAS superfamily LD-carboxypeptidase LdcB